MASVHPLDGRLVQVSGHDLVPPSEEMLAVDPELQSLDLDGHRGRAWWSESTSDYIVETFSGATVNLSADRLAAYDPPPGQEGGFDAIWPSHPDDNLEFGLEVANMLATKGYCVIQGFMSDAARSDALRGFNDCDTWQRFIAELEPGYLGRKAAGKVAWLDNKQEAYSQLDACDQQLTELSVMLEPMSLGSLGFSAIGRTDGLLRAHFEGQADEDAIMSARETLDETKVAVFGKVEDHLKFIQTRKICLFFFVSGTGGNLFLHRKDNVDVTIPCVEGRIVAFRHDRLSYTYDPAEEGYALQAWVLADGQATVMQEYTGPPENFHQAIGVHTGPMAPVYGKTGKTVGLMSMDCMLAGNGIGPEFFWTFLVCGTDTNRHLSCQRWDHTWYYEPNKELAMGKYYSNHGGFVLEEHLMGFDADFFGIDPEVVEMMDPIQRNTLEVGYNALNKAGWHRESLKNAQIGVFIGNCGTDWTSVKLQPAVCPVNEGYVHLYSAHSLSTRLSFTFGMRGPVSTSDTACSSSLVAAGTAHNAMRRVEPDQARIGNHSYINSCVIVGTNALLGPFSWIGLCGPHMLSPQGRCFTFDGSADGFSRGEGTTAVTAAITSGTGVELQNKRLAVFCGTCINQDGRSASMTAPHGPSQQECIWGSLREANVKPGDIRIAELHGTGTALGDPIEVGALRGVMKSREDPIIKTSAKSNLGHAEANAGSAGLVKCFMMLVHGVVPPNVHLHHLNPHVDTNAYPVLFSDEMTDLGTNSGYAGVSSFGFGGTNARADLWARCTVGPRKANDLDWNKLDYVIVRCPRCYGWMEHVSCAMMPSRPERPPAGRYKADMIRDEFDSYDECSLCYKGSYQMGSPPKESSIPEGRMYIAGSWDAWTGRTEVEQDPNGAWHFFARLGETRMEQFRFMLEENDNFAFYPAAPRGGAHVRTEGPCQWKEGHNWLIDARDDEWPEGQLIHITMTPDRQSGARVVAWEAVNEDSGPSEFQSYRHSYQVLGSWSSYELCDMDLVASDRGTFQYSLRIGPTGQELFQVVRDRDPQQVIYPAYAKSTRKGVSARGPDHLGKGKFFGIRGEPGERALIKSRVLDGQISVSVTVPSEGVRTWQSVSGKYWKCFFVAGSWTQGCELMEEDTNHVYRAEVTISEQGYEDFQVLMDEDAERAYYPETEGFASGQVFVCGPDADSQGRFFRMEGVPGQRFEILLSAKVLDRRKLVTWRPLLQEGYAAVPWCNSSPLK